MTDWKKLTEDIVNAYYGKTTYPSFAWALRRAEQALLVSEVSQVDLNELVRSATGKIDAIKKVRAKTGMGLLEAKGFVEEMYRS